MKPEEKIIDKKGDVEVIENQRTGAQHLRKVYVPSDFTPHAMQFCDLLTAQPPAYTYQELREDFGATDMRHQASGRVLCIMRDNSSVEFFTDAAGNFLPMIRAHGPDELQRVLNMDSRLWPENRSH